MLDFNNTIRVDCGLEWIFSENTCCFRQNDIDKIRLTKAGVALIDETVLA